MSNAPGSPFRIPWRARLIAALLLLSATRLSGQDVSVVMPSRPALPHTASENWSVKRFRLQRASIVYDSWTVHRTIILKAPPGTIVSGLGKLSVVYRPAIVTITAAMPRFGLRAGDTIYRYTIEGEGFADFWIKGRWFKELDGSFITEPDTNGCSRNCSGKVTTLGRAEEWSRVRLHDGRIGWIRDSRGAS